VLGSVTVLLFVQLGVRLLLQYYLVYKSILVRASMRLDLEGVLTFILGQILLIPMLLLG
jgi:hypothetical protein